jgi:hypothetical protein
MSLLKGPPPAAALTGAAHRRLRYVQPEVHKLVSVKGSTTGGCSYQGCPQKAQTCVVGSRTRTYISMSQLKGPPPAAALTRAPHSRLRHVQLEVHKPSSQRVNLTGGGVEKAEEAQTPLTG